MTARSPQQRGNLALSGQIEYLPSHLFDLTDKDRWIRGKGALVMVFDPEAMDATSDAKPPWKWKDVDAMSPWTLVPKGHKIKVFHAWVEISYSPPSSITT